MRINRTLIWTVAIMAALAFTTAPAAEAFVYPVVAALTLGGVIGLFGMGAKTYIAHQQAPEADDIQQAEKEGPPANSSAAAAADR